MRCGSVHLHIKVKTQHAPRGYATSQHARCLPCAITINLRAALGHQMRSSELLQVLVQTVHAIRAKPHTWPAAGRGRADDEGQNRRRPAVYPAGAVALPSACARHASRRHVWPCLCQCGQPGAADWGWSVSGAELQRIRQRIPMERGVTTAPLASEELSVHCTSVRILQAAVRFVTLRPLPALF